MDDNPLSELEQAPFTVRAIGHTARHTGYLKVITGGPIPMIAVYDNKGKTDLTMMVPLHAAIIERPERPVEDIERGPAEPAS